MALVRKEDAVKMHIKFALRYWVRKDDEAKTFVAYIPVLRLYTQSKDKARLGEAVKDLVYNFVQLCHGRGILDDVMRERGLSRIVDSPQTDSARPVVEDDGEEYIMVGTPAEPERYAVPITLLVGEREMAECLP